jgi:hypothetical protein
MNGRIETMLGEMRALAGGDLDMARHVDAIETALAAVHRRGNDDTRSIATWDELCRIAGRDAPLKERLHAVSGLLTRWVQELGWRQPS